MLALVMLVSSSCKDDKDEDDSSKVSYLKCMVNGQAWPAAGESMEASASYQLSSPEMTYIYGKAGAKELRLSIMIPRGTVGVFQRPTAALSFTGEGGYSDTVMVALSVHTQNEIAGTFSGKFSATQTNITNGEFKIYLP